MTRASVNKRTQSLCEELNMEIQGTWFDIQLMKMLVEATWWEFKTRQQRSKPELGTEVSGA
jgi:hypothetical protein